MSQPISMVDHIVEQVRLSQHIDRQMVENMLHTSLQKTAGTTYFDTFEAKGIDLSGLVLDAELRTPVRGSGATGGAILTMRITHGCPRKAEVEARYKPLAIANVPHGRSLDEETVWARQESWGDFAFGFAEREPDCLSSISFKAKGGADGA